VRGRLDALLVLTGNSVETLHPMEIPHAWQVFYFRRGDLREMGSVIGH